MKRRKFLYALSRPSCWSALRHGVAPAIEHRSIGLPIQFRTVIDVGAHHGQFALYALGAYSGATVICVDPLADTDGVLRKVFADNPRVSIVAGAADSERATRTLSVSRSSDSSSLRPPTAVGRETWPEIETVSHMRVQVAPLDELLAGTELVPPVLLKVDVQGCELDVLRGAADTLSKADAVVAECSFVQIYEDQPLADEVIGFLRERGLRLAGVHSVTRNAAGGYLQADFVFQRVSCTSAREGRSSPGSSRSEVLRLASGEASPRGLSLGGKG